MAGVYRECRQNDLSVVCAGIGLNNDVAFGAGALLIISAFLYCFSLGRFGGV